VPAIQDEIVLTVLKQKGLVPVIAWLSSFASHKTTVFSPKTESVYTQNTKFSYIFILPFSSHSYTYN